MGYRLDVYDLDDKNVFYGTKLFGYVDEADTFTSEWFFDNFLRGKEYPSDWEHTDVYWGYNAPHTSIMSAVQYAQFIALYLADLAQYGMLDKKLIGEILPTIDGKGKKVEWS